ncbi:MAG TPA: cobalamin biosynthesis protein CbiX [Clostridia bacterium]|nr:cobalamin biosynthesis protein CbiX [Clostridia bacterium]
MAKGIILLGHGSRARVDEANQLLVEMASLLKNRIRAGEIAPAWMNSKSGRPGLREVAARLAEAGFTEIIVAPWFLTSGLHIQEDIPEMLEELRQRYPRVRFALARPLGADPRLADILAERIQEVEDAVHP